MRMKTKMRATKIFLGGLALAMALAAASPALALGKRRFVELCRAGDAQALKEELENDPGFVRSWLDDEGETPLMKAAEETRSAEVIRVLLEAGADVNDQDDDGETPLMYAMDDYADLAVVRALLDGGAEINIKDEKDRTALMHALKEHATPEVIALLLEAGSDVNARDYEGRSVLDYAERSRSIRGTEALRRLKAASR